MHPGGAVTLQDLELIGVEQQLEDVARLGVGRELGIVDFVGPGAKLRGLLDTDEEVRVADAPICGKARLIENRVAGAHRLERPRGPNLGAGARIIERDHLDPLGLEPRQDRILVALPTLHEQRHPRRTPLRVKLSAALEDVEMGPMLAIQKAIQRARRHTR
jgi:hypothetical protein